MRKLFAILLLPALAGCLTTNEIDVSSWTLEYLGPKESTKPQQGVVRVANVSVRAPWDREKMAVRRADGSLAFDNYHEYAAHPAYLIRGAVFDALRAKGPYQYVVNQSSLAASPVAVEVLVTQLYLDCTNEKSRKATIALSVRCIDDRKITSVTTGAASVEVIDNNFGSAFSKAMTDALVEAIEKIR